MRHHLLIGGTGRAGTTFLVEYLAACGLETHLATNSSPFYDEDANAGLEDSPFDDSKQPYVLKSPWMYEYVKRLLADKDISVDGVIIPMRDIVEAATSRVVNELRARYANEALPDDPNLWESWGTTAGGVTYSLNPIDQARLLALGFHELLNALVKHNIPVVFLDFPRFITDADYLYKQLQPLIGDKVEHAKSLFAHRAVVDPSKVRISRELADVQRPALAFPSHSALDRIALKRELDKSRGRIAQLVQQLLVANTLQTRITDQDQQVATALAGEAASTERIAILTASMKRYQHDIEQQQQRISALQSSRSWRMTAPMRAISSLFKT